MEAVYILVDTPPDFEPVEDGKKLQARWEVQILPELPAYVWKLDPVGGLFHMTGYEHFGALGDDLLKFMDQLNIHFTIELIKNRIPHFEIRPVSVVKI